MSKESKENRDIIARTLLKRNKIGVRKKKGNYVFVVPHDLANKLVQEYSFNFEQLKVGGDIPLPELARHVDEQASLEAEFSLVCEISRYTLENERLVYEEWHESLSYKCRAFLQEKHNKAPTEGQLKNYMFSKYGKKIRKKKMKIVELEAQYRILNNVIRSAIVVKGQLLPTLRNIVQGKTGIGINVESEKTKAKIKT